MSLPETEQFSLRWNNFHSNLSSGFHDLLEGEDLVDVTLACDGTFVQAHKIVLSVCSPYFKQLFKVLSNHYYYVFSVYYYVFSSLSARK